MSARDLIFPAILGLLLASAGTATAADLSYDELRLGFRSIDAESLGYTGTGAGVGVEFSKSLGERFFVTGSYYSDLADDGDLAFVLLDVEISLRELSLRGGWRQPLGESTDLVVEAGYGDLTIETRLLGIDIGGAEGSGGQLRVGLRHLATERLELGLGVGQAFYADQGLAIEGGLAFRIGEHFGLTMSYHAGESVDAVSGGVRWTF